MLRRPPYSLQPLRQNRVRVVVGRVHPVGIHTAQVLDLQLDKRGGEFAGVAETVGEFICVRRRGEGVVSRSL